MEDYLRGRTRALLGHVIRGGREEPMHRATFRDETLQRITVKHRRVGRPRKTWLEETVKKFWNEEMETREIAEVEFSWNEEEHREALAQAAYLCNL